MQWPFLHHVRIICGFSVILQVLGVPLWGKFAILKDVLFHEYLDLIVLPS